MSEPDAPKPIYAPQDDPAKVNPMITAPRLDPLVVQLEKDIEGLKFEGKCRRTEDDFDDDGTGGDWYFGVANRIEALLAARAASAEAHRRLQEENEALRARVASLEAGAAPTGTTASGRGEKSSL